MSNAFMGVYKKFGLGRIKLRELAMRHGLGVITYYSLASGFLTGKYRGEGDLQQSARGGGVRKYLTPRGMGILGALDEVAADEPGRAGDEVRHLGIPDRLLSFTLIP